MCLMCLEADVIKASFTQKSFSWILIPVKGCSSLKKKKKNLLNFLQSYTIDTEDSVDFLLIITASK